MLKSNLKNYAQFFIKSEIVKISLFYNRKCNTITIITPGIPKNPTINAVIHVISSAINPVRLIKNNITPPIRALINSFIIIFIGKDINFKIINKTIIAPKKVKTSVNMFFFSFFNFLFFFFYLFF